MIGLIQYWILFIITFIMTTDNLIDNSFNYCDKDFIRVSYNKAWFSQSDKKTSGHYIFY